MPLANYPARATRLSRSRRAPRRPPASRRPLTPRAAPGRRRTLKIDRGFVSGLGRQAEDEAIVSAIISMGRALGVDVVAEGVETGEQAEMLWRLGCELAQGFHFARPLSAGSAAELMRRA